MSTNNPFQIHPASSQPATAGPKVKDPVCDMDVTPAQAAGSFEYQGHTYYFCGKGCLAKFQADPQKYLKPRSRLFRRPAAKGIEYTCPMHPEVVQIGPGTCPICGMALEPKSIQADEAENPELADMQKRFWVSVALSVPLLVISMAMLGPSDTRAWIELALATPVVLWGGWPFFVRAWQSIVSRPPEYVHADRLGVGVAYVYSLFAAFFPPAFPLEFRDDMGQVPVYFEAAAVIVTLVLLGQVLELKARSRTGAAIKALLGLAPKTARLIRTDGTETDVPLDQVP